MKKLKLQNKFAASLLITALSVTACTVTPDINSSGAFNRHDWNHHDIDRDFSLNKAEFENLLKHDFTGLDKDKKGYANLSELPSHIHHFDKNGDGKLTWDEHKEAGFKEFAKADLDNNNILSTQEIASLDFLRR